MGQNYENDSDVTNCVVHKTYVVDRPVHLKLWYTKQKNVKVYYWMLPDVTSIVKVRQSKDLLQTSTLLVKCCNATPLKVLFPDFVEGLPKILDFGYFVLIWWQSDKKQEILKLKQS